METTVARNNARPAKRSTRPNPRADRNRHDDNILDFPSESGRPAKRNKYRGSQETSDRQNASRNADAQRSSEGFAKPKKINIVPRNLAQERYLEALEDERNIIVACAGSAGSGKSYISTLFGMRGLANGDFQKIIITRPAVSVDEQHGFLPGNLIAKCRVWNLAIIDTMVEFFGAAKLETMLEDGTIEMAPLAYMRGRTFKNSFIILDEAQNCTKNQVLMCASRIGEGSRMVITGDTKQHDRGFADNGLKDFLERLSTHSSKQIAVCHFSPSDVERHPIVEEVLRLYGEE